MFRTLALTLLGLGLMAGTAQAQQTYERVTLRSGRVYVGVVTDLPDGSLAIRLPSGLMRVDPLTVTDRQGASEAEYGAQGRAQVVVHDAIAGVNIASDAEALSAYLRTQLAELTTVAFGTAEVLNQLTPEEQLTFQACPDDPGCLVPLLEDAQLDHLIIPTLEVAPNGWLATLEGYRSDLGSTGSIQVEYLSRPEQAQDAIREALQDLLQIAPDMTTLTRWIDEEQRGGTSQQQQLGVGSRATASWHPNGRLTRQQLVGLSFVPLPGLPALVDGRTGPWALGAGLGLAATTGSVIGFGAASPTAPGFFVPAILVSYGSVVGINLATALAQPRRRRGPVVGAALVPGPDGVHAGISGRF